MKNNIVDQYIQRGTNNQNSSYPNRNSRDPMRQRNFPESPLTSLYPLIISYPN